jgi:hypothetical protein
MKKVTANTLVELYELCLDICPFPAGDRAGVCPKCPLNKHVQEKNWRVPFGEAIKLVKAWATYVGKKV